MHLAHRHLVRAPETFGLLAVNFLWARPSLGRAQNDHRPKRPLGLAIANSSCLDALDLLDDHIERGRHELMHFFRLVSLDEMRGVAVAAEEMIQFFMTDSRQHAGIGDLVAVKVKDRENHPVGKRVQKFVRVPARCQGPGLGLAVADDAGHDQIRVIEGRAVGVRHGVTQLPSLVDRAGRLGGDMAGDAAWERKLLEQILHPLFVL